MNETELENLVVRITGDTLKYQKSMEDAAKTAQDAAAKAEASTLKFEKLAESMNKFGDGIAKALGTIGIGMEFKGAVERFEAFEKAGIKMNATLEANGRDVNKTTKEYKDFAKEMSNVSMSSAGEVKALLQTAESFGLTGEAAKKAAKDALSLAAATDASAETAMRLTAAVARGDTEKAMHMARSIAPLRGVTDPTEFMDKYQKLTAAGSKAMAAEMETSWSKIEKMQQQMAGVTREIGGVIAEGIRPAVEGLGALAKGFQALDPATRQAVATTLAATAGYMALANVLPLIGTQFKAMAANPMAWIAGAAVLIYALARAVVEASPDIEKFNKLLKEGEDYRIKSFDEHRAASRDTVAKASKMDKGDQTQFLEAELAKQKKILEAADKEVKDAQEQYDKRVTDGYKDRQGPLALLNRGWIGVKQSLGGTAGKPEESFLKDAESARKAAAMAVEDLKRVLQGTSATEEVNTYIKHLQKEGEQAGMTAEQLKVLQLTRMGMTDDQREGVMLQQGLAEQAKALAAAEKHVDDLTASYKLQADTIGMTAAEVEAYKAAMAGVDPEKIRDMLILGADAESHQQHKTRIDEAVAFAEQTLEAMKTPAEKVQDQIDKLGEAMVAGAIDMDEYAAAVAHVQKALEGMTAASRDATQAGTAEALSRINASLEGGLQPSTFGANWRFNQNGVPQELPAWVDNTVAPPNEFDAPPNEWDQGILDAIKAAKNDPNAWVPGGLPQQQPQGNAAGLPTGYAPEQIGPKLDKIADLLSNMASIAFTSAGFS